MNRSHFTWKLYHRETCSAIEGVPMNFSHAVWNQHRSEVGATRESFPFNCRHTIRNYYIAFTITIAPPKYLAFFFEFQITFSISYCLCKTKINYSYLGSCSERVYFFDKFLNSLTIIFMSRKPICLMNDISKMTMFRIFIHRMIYMASETHMETDS